MVYLVTQAFYNLYLHPLSAFPGPKIAAISQIPIAKELWTGKVHVWLRQLHDTYASDVVRVSPNELSFISPEAWKDIYSTRPGHPGFPKDPVAFGGKNSILTANNADHSRMRRLLSHAFSEKALREQEGLIKVHVQTLIDGIKKQIAGPAKGKINIVDWYHWATFDIIGDLAFGEPFNCLQDAKWTPWVAKLVQGLKAVALISVATRFLLLERLLRLYISRTNLVKDSIEHGRLSHAKVERRLKFGNDRPDFMSYVLRHNNSPSQGGMTEAEIHRNASVFINAGSQTTATFFCGATWFILQHPAAVRRIRREIDAVIAGGPQGPRDLCLKDMPHLPYFQAFIQECHRMYPGSLAGLPRSAASPQGDTAAGIHIPPGTGVHLNQFAAYHSPRNFHSPDTFLPERWLVDNNDPRFKSDRRDILQPFAMGPRNCIGKNLAMAEIALLVGRVVMEFDVWGVEETDEGWLDQRAWFGFDKKPLVVGVREREREGEGGRG